MRKVGEVKLSAIPSKHKSMEQHQSNIKNRKKDNLVKCRNEGCDNEWYMSVNQMRATGHGVQPSCYDCWQKGKKETQQALINLAKRKGLI